MNAEQIGCGLQPGSDRQCVALRPRITAPRCL